MRTSGCSLNQSRSQGAPGAQISPIRTPLPALDLPRGFAYWRRRRYLDMALGMPRVSLNLRPKAIIRGSRGIPEGSKLGLGAELAPLVRHAAAQPEAR